MPAAFSNPEKALQANMLRCLLQFEPSKRPSCVELLDLVPAQDDDQTFQLLRRELRDPNSQLRSETIHTLFAQPADDNLALDFDSLLDLDNKLAMQEGVAAMSRHSSDLELQTKIKHKISSIFRRHGAVERTDSPVIFPYHPFYSAADVIRILDSSGNVLQLPYDLILPNAILLARSARFERKTFAFGDVYRPDLRKQQPNIYGEVDFDIDGMGMMNLALQEAEVIKAIDEVIDTFPSLYNTDMCYHINHSHVLNRILVHCDVERAKWFSAKETLSKLNTADWTWAKVRHELRSPPLSLPGTILDELERFDFRETVEKAILKLHSLLRDTSDIETSFSHLHNILLYLSRMDVTRKVYLSPLSSYNEKFYRGHAFFQCLYDRKRRAVFAAGGRYDRLIRDYQAVPSRESIVHGVGFHMSWSGLCAAMLSYLNSRVKIRAKRKPQADQSTWKTRRCDVLIDYHDTKLRDRSAIKLMSDLWANNISTELADVDQLGTSSNFARSSPAKENHGWTVLIKGSDTVKVRNTSRQDENEVRIVDLVHYLGNEIRERDRREGRNAPMTLPRLDSQQSVATISQDAEVKVLLSQSKTKKMNRKTIVEEALSRAQEWRDASLENPIVAVETRDDIFQGLQSTKLDDPDSWKRLIQAAPPGDRQYLTQLQHILKAEQEAKAVFLYNFRSKSILFYALSTNSGLT